MKLENLSLIETQQKAVSKKLFDQYEKYDVLVYSLNYATNKTSSFVFFSLGFDLLAHLAAYLIVKNKQQVNTEAED